MGTENPRRRGCAGSRRASSSNALFDAEAVPHRLCWRALRRRHRRRLSSLAGNDVPGAVRRASSGICRTPAKFLIRAQRSDDPRRAPVSVHPPKSIFLPRTPRACCPANSRRLEQAWPDINVFLTTHVHIEHRRLERGRFRGCAVRMRPRRDKDRAVAVSAGRDAPGARVGGGRGRAWRTAVVAARRGRPRAECPSLRSRHESTPIRVGERLHTLPSARSTMDPEEASKRRDLVDVSDDERERLASTTRGRS